MKLKIYCILSLLIATPCFALMGGVSGGGGNVINPTPPDEINQDLHQTTEHVEHLIHSSHIPVSKFFKLKENQLNNNQVSVAEALILRKLFTGDYNIYRIMHLFPTKVQEDKPCFDSLGNAVDGSIYSEKPNTICVSAHRLVEKVHISEIPIQSHALLVHEYSELVGLTEDEAVLLQKNALDIFKQQN